MNENIINMTIKIFIMNILTFLINWKIFSRNLRKLDILEIIVASSIITVGYIYLEKYIDKLLNIIIVYILQLLIMKMIIRDKEENMLISNLIASAIVYISFCVSAIIEVPIMLIIRTRNKIINGILVDMIEIAIIFCFFKIKRFNKGFAFIKDNEFTNIIMFNISAMIILAYYIYGKYYGNLTTQLIICFSLLSIIMIIMIQKTLTLYYKQKLLAKNIEDYKSEIALKDAQIKSLSDEKYKISKLNHEFYNRQKALIHKVEEITSMNTEIADELDLSKQINDLTKEYTDKAQEIKTLDKLPTTGIVEIDDMFKYMQSECKSKNIQFNLKVNGNIYHMINNKIPQSRLVTLIGDHLRDAIIAIDFSNNTFKSILAVL